MTSITPRTLDRTKTVSFASCVPSRLTPTFLPTNEGEHAESAGKQPGLDLTANFRDGASQSTVPKFEDYSIRDQGEAEDAAESDCCELTRRGDDDTQNYSKNVRRHG